MTAPDDPVFCRLCGVEIVNVDGHELRPSGVASWRHMQCPRVAALTARPEAKAGYADEQAMADLRADGGLPEFRGAAEADRPDAEARDSIVMAAETMRELCAQAIERAASLGGMPLDASERATIVRNFKIPDVPVAENTTANLRAEAGRPAALTGRPEPVCAYCPATGTGAWQDIATFPHATLKKAAFWIVPKDENETYLDGQNRPITADHEPYLHVGGFGNWGALSKATHWQPVYDYGRPPAPSTERG